MPEQTLLLCLIAGLIVTGLERTSSATQRQDRRGWFRGLLLIAGRLSFGVLLALVLILTRIPEQPETARTPDSAGMFAVSRWSQGGCDAVATYAGVTYVGSGSELLVFRDSVLVARIATAGACEGLTVAGERLYAATGRTGMVVFDITCPVEPQLVSTTRLPGQARGIDVRGSTAGIAGGPDGLFLLDIENVNQPRVVGAAVLAESVKAVALLEGLLLAACGRQGLAVVRPEHGLNLLAWFECPSPALDVAHKDSVVYAVCGDSGVIVVDLSQPEQPRRIRRLDLPFARAMAISDTLAVAVSGEWGTWILSVSNPAQPYVWCYLPVPGYADDVALNGSRLAVACGPNGLYQYNLSRPTFPVLVHHAPFSGLTIDVAADRDVAWVCTSSGLHAVDLGVREAQELGFLALPACPTALALGRGFGLASTADSGIVSFSTANPKQPVLLGSRKSPGLPGPIVIQDSWAFVGVAGYGIQVLNVARPESMVDVGALRDVPGPVDLSLGGRFLVLAAAESGLYFCDIRRANSPQVVQWELLPGRVNAVWYDTTTFAAGESGLFVFDTRDVTNPRLLASVPLGAEARDVVVFDTLCYVACGAAGVICFSVRKQRAPCLLGHYRGPTEVHRLGLVLSDILIADLRCGLARVRLKQGTEPGALPAGIRPTVTRGVLTLPADRGQPTAHRVELLDICGRRALELHAGTNDVRRLAPGVYFVHQTAGGHHRPSRSRVLVMR